jgi:hypothetical protein
MNEVDAVPDLYRLAYMPGQFRCPICKFQLSKQTMFVQSGSIGVSETDLESEECPNDGTPMIHVTYREQISAYDDRLKEEFDRVDRIKAAAEALLLAMETCHICKGILLFPEVAPHCEDCSWDCEDHEEPSCNPIQSLSQALRNAIGN